MITSPSPPVPSSSRSNGAFGSSLPQWRSFLSTLNWRRDPGYEQRMKQHEWSYPDSVDSDQGLAVVSLRVLMNCCS
jgi:hypothetical protein